MSKRIEFSNWLSISEHSGREYAEDTLKAYPMWLESRLLKEFQIPNIESIFDLHDIEELKSIEKKYMSGILTKNGQNIRSAFKKYIEFIQSHPKVDTSIKSIASEINLRSIDYNFGELQEIRKRIKRLNKKPTTDIFNNQTITEDWAFHVGGRSELQFNIGLEAEGLRYGFAFSLEPSRSLPSIDILYPKILRLNTTIIENPLLFKKYKMWNWNKERSVITDVNPISSVLVKQGNFIFIGKLIELDKIDFDEILTTFDELLSIYIEVEENHENIPSLQSTDLHFRFNNSKRNLPQSTSYSSVERQINVEARHTYIQEKLIEELTELFGDKCIGVENYIGGNKIDVVLQLKENEYIFYEIKTANSAKACVRQAIGQLLEYSYYNCEKLACQIVVVGEHEIDASTEKYLRYLKKEFNLPIAYKSVQ